MTQPEPTLSGNKPGVGDVIDYIRSKILLGEYGPDGRLVEEQIARELGVSRTPVRQALTTIEAEGLVEIFPNRGAIVASFSPDEVWRVYDLRAVLEGLAARRAAENVGKADLDKLHELTVEMESIDQELRDVKAPPGRLGDEAHKELIRRLVNANQDFHRTIMVASSNRRLEKLVRRTVQLPMVLKAFSWYIPAERAVSNHQHRKIVRVIESGDAVRAELVMTEHIYEGRDVILRALEEDRVCETGILDRNSSLALGADRQGCSGTDLPG